MISQMVLLDSNFDALPQYCPGGKAGDQQH